MANAKSPLSLRILQYTTLALLALLVLLAGLMAPELWNSAKKPRHEAIAPFVLRASAPVAVDITYRPTTIEKYSDRVFGASGPAEYTFTNLTTAPIRIAFPPVRVFGFSEDSLSMGKECPKFAQESRVVEIPVGESVSFEDQQDFTATEAFLDGGMGWIAFVFSRPADAETDEDYCVGTVFAKYAVQTEQGSGARDVSTKGEIEFLRGSHNLGKRED